MANSDLTRIAGNIGAMNSLWSLSNINKQLSVHQSRLASGKRINSAADDPAGLTIATKMRARSEGLKVALGNISDAKNLTAVAESGLGRINDILVEMRNKAEAGASDTMGVSERKALVQQMQAYAAQIDDIVLQTKWNDTKLIAGAFDSGSLTFQTGADEGDTTVLTGLKNLSASGVGSLLIAEKSSSATVTAGTDANSISSGEATSATINNNLSALSSGTYTIEVTYGGTLGSSSSVRLLDSGGNAMLIQATNSQTAAVAKSRTGIDLSVATGAASVVDFGNGLQATIAQMGAPAPTANGTFTATVSYTSSGTYTLKDAGSNTIDENSTADKFAGYMTFINAKLDTVTEQLSKVGALTSRLNFKEDQVSAAQINIEGAYNRIMNADMAEEQVNASKYQILQQTATAMLAQANSAPQFILSLFR